MLISDLQARLRLIARERIGGGDITGTELAQRAGFRQAHISNFLNRRRGLSLEAMDKVMKILNLDVSDLMPPERRWARGSGGVDGAFDAIPVVTREALLKSEFGEGDVLESLHFRKSYLRRIRPDMASERGGWERFLMIRTDRDSGEAMRPRLQTGAMLLVDRQYNSLRAYRKREPNMYVVKHGETVKVRYLELQGNQLTMRPENQRYMLGYVPIEPRKTFADYIVGRVAHVSIET